MIWKHLFAAACLLPILAAAESFSVTGTNGKTYQVEDLGRPAHSKEVPVDAITTSADGSRIAWGDVESADAFGLFGRKLEGDDSFWVDLKPFGRGRAEIAAYQDKVYIILSAPQVKALVLDTATMQITQLRTYPEAGKNAYWNAGHARTADDKMYVGLYPFTFVVGIDLKNGKALDLIRVQKNPEQKYIVLPAVDDNNILYCPVGLVRQELYAVNLNTGEIKELLKGSPAENNLKGTPKVYLEKDGQCTLLANKKYFRCSFDGLTPITNAGTHSQFPDNRRTKKNLIGPKTHVLRFTDEGLLISRGYGKNTKITKLPIQHELPGINVFGVHEENNGKLYGSSVFPGRIFEYDIASGKSTDLGSITSGAIQCYDILKTPAGLVMSSYTGGNLDLYKPDQPIKKGQNPRPLISLAKTGEQERIQRLVRAGAHYVCGGTIPIKGILGGGIVRLDLRNNQAEFFRNIIPNQSINCVIAIPDTTLLFGAASIAGGTGAIAKAKTAEIFLWDYEKAELVWQEACEPDVISYTTAALTADNQIFFWARKGKLYHWRLFDPATRKIVAKGSLPKPLTSVPYLHPLPAGKYQRNYFLAQGWCGYFDPETKTVKTLFHDPRLFNKGTWQYCHVEPDGTLYFPVGTHMLRIKLEE